MSQKLTLRIQELEKSIKLYTTYIKSVQNLNAKHHTLINDSLSILSENLALKQELLSVLTALRELQVKD